MAKPTMQFNAVAYNLNGHNGLRPQFIQKEAVVDLDLCKEVVNERRLTTSPEELMHGFASLADVAMAKVSVDGRPRAITKLIKFAPFATGKLESPSSPWDPAKCKGIVRAVLLSDATRTFDATFQNVTEGIGVRLNDVTYLGAKTVQNVIKAGVRFAAYGSHMEFIEGDTASLKIGTLELALTCVESDVSSAVFECPEELADYEPGTQALFLMKSRGGVTDGQVYTSKKTVTIVAGDPVPGPIVKKATSAATGNANEVKVFDDTLTIEGRQFDAKTEVYLKLYKKQTGAELASQGMSGGNHYTLVDDRTMTLVLADNVSSEPDDAWKNPTNEVRLITKDAEGESSIVLAAK